jgi:predicted lipoprotein with Yx(FWY)xxD motif
LSPRITLVVATTLVLVACGGAVADTATTLPAPPGTTTSPTDPASISVGDSPLGTILIGPGGMTLYVFTPDDAGPSTCHDQCAVLWPPVPGDTPIDPGLDGSMFGTETRPDGMSQLTVNGWPLYMFITDGAPGEATGQGVEGVWFVVDAAGQMIGGQSGPGGSGGSDTTDPDYDYGY